MKLPRRAELRLWTLLAASLLAPVSPARADGDRDGQRAGKHAPLVTLLTPRAGTAVNATTLSVQALVAAFKPHASKTFIFNGQRMNGQNVGQVSHVELALDGAVIERLKAAQCRRQLLADFRVDLTRFGTGPHTLTVTAFHHDQPRIGGSASVRFTLDPTLPPATVSRIEQALTPTPVACLALHGEEAEGDDDDDRRQIELQGELVLGRQSDGIDLGIVIALGSHAMVLEPGMLRARRKATASAGASSRTLPRPSSEGSGSSRGGTRP